MLMTGNQRIDKHPFGPYLGAWVHLWVIKPLEGLRHEVRSLGNIALHFRHTIIILKKYFHIIKRLMSYFIGYKYFGTACARQRPQVTGLTMAKLGLAYSMIGQASVAAENTTMAAIAILHCFGEAFS